MGRTVSLLVVIVLFAAAFPASAQVERFTDCNADAQENIGLAFQYLQANMGVLVNDYEFDAKMPRKDDRVRRRMKRELNNTKVHCPGRNDPRCRDDSIGRSGGLMTSRIHICFTKALEEGMSFCSLVGTVAHEYGHSIGMARDIGHNSGAIDATEMFGWFVADMCRQDNLDRPLSPGAALTPNPGTPTQGITVFPRINRTGRSRNYIGNNDDLRREGRDDSASSLEVLTSNWEVCERRDFLGWCLDVHPGEVINDLRQRGINNEISSFRVVTLPRTGITLFKNRGRQGLSRSFTAESRDLSQMGLNDKASSLTVHTGSWQLCRQKGFRDCVTVDAGATVDDLRTLGINDRITSLRPQ